MKHDATHESLLERWIAGEPLTEREERDLQSCEECMVKKNDLESVAQRLDTLGSEGLDRELEELLEAEPTAWENRTLGFLGKVMEETPPGEHEVVPEENRAATSTAKERPSGRRPWVWVALAAAAALALYLLPGGGKPTQPRENTWLSAPGQTITGLSPEGDVDEIGVFSWTFETGPLWTYELRFYRPGETTPFHTATTESSPWQPDVPADFWPESFLWEVEARDAHEQPTGFGRCGVQLRSSD